MAGFPKGTRLKEDKDMHRHRFSTHLTDAELQDLYWLSNKWDMAFAVVFRKCFNIVCAMSDNERDRALYRIEQ